MNNKEGIRYIAFGLAVLLLLAVGIWKVRPFPWLNAREARIEGEMTINGKTFEFEGAKSLLVDNSRTVRGVATALDGAVVFFDALGAGVTLDEIGCLKGSVALADQSMLELSKPGQCDFVVGDDGRLQGEIYLEDTRKITINATTDWKPYELSEIQVDQTLKVEKGETQQIDAKVMALGGRELSDATVIYKSNNENVKVDEYGYVEVSGVGEYKNAVTLQAGGRERAVTILAVQEKVGLKSLSPEVVLANDQPYNFIATFNNELGNFEIESIRFFKGVGTGDDEVNCTGDKNNIDTVAINCFFAKNKVGTWNLEIVTKDRGTFAFASKLVALNPEASLSLAMTSKVVMPGDFTDAGAQSQPGNYCGFDPNNITDPMKECISKDQTVFKEDRIYLYPSLMWPSFFAKGNTYEIGSVSYPKIEAVIDGENKDKCSGNLDLDKSNILGSISVGQYNANLEDPTKSLFSIGYVKYNSDFPSGCVLVLRVEAEIVMKKIGSSDTLKLIGETQTRSNIRTRKHVLLEGDVMVQTGDISVKKINPAKSMYSLSASENIDISQDADTRITDGNQKNFGINELYETDDGTDAYFSNVVDKMREKVSKLLVERGQEISYSDLNSKLTSFSTSDFSLSPEGWILSLKNYPSDVTINTTNICGPKTLVVQGHDVYIKGNIANVSSCAEKGNFGLIVLDGSIYVDPAVTDISGFYFTTGTFYTGESHLKFTLKGAAVAHNFVLQRY